MLPDPGPTSPVIRSQELLKPYTTFKIGGPARYFVLARTEVDFRAALNLAERESLPFFVLEVAATSWSATAASKAWWFTGSAAVSPPGARTRRAPPWR